MAERKSDFALPTLDDLFSTQQEREDAKLEKIRNIPLDLIDDFPDHPFHVRDDEDMVQLVVWELCTGCRDASTFKLKNSKFIDGITSGSANPNVKTNYNKIIAKLEDYNTIPSFAYETSAKAKSNVNELKYSDGKYSITLTDSNNILSDYDFKTTDGVSVSVSGKKITLTSTKAIPDAVVFSATKKMPKVTTTLIACGSSSKQDVVTGVQSDTETKTAYFDESPTTKLNINGTYVKEYWGEGSNRARNWQRYDLGGKSKLSFEEGVDSYVTYAGPLKDNVAKSLYKVKSTMCNCGVTNIPDLQKNAKLTVVPSTSIVEGGYHDVMLKSTVQNNR